MNQEPRMIPDVVVGRALSLGCLGETWLKNLDQAISDLEGQWRIRVGEAMSGGSHAFVGFADGLDGGRFVLKVDIPDCSDEDFMNEVRTLQIAGGEGYVRLYAFDVQRRATLLERLGPRLATMDLPVDRQMEIICKALMQTWSMPVGEIRLPDGMDSIRWFRSFISDTWESLGHPCPKIVIDRAMEYLDSREEHLNPDEYVLIHGDAHNNNTLQSLTAQDHYKLIDPDGLFYEPAYDLGVLMREWPEEYGEYPMKRGLERCAYLSRLTGVDARGIWEWGYLQTVSTSLVLLQIGQTDLAEQMLRTALAWTERATDE